MHLVRKRCCNNLDLKKLNRCEEGSNSKGEGHDLDSRGLMKNSQIKRGGMNITEMT